LIELGGDDLRREPLEVRKATLASVLAKAGPGIRRKFLHLDYDDGAAVFQHACKMGLEGIVSKRKDSLYRSGRSKNWLKMKNPACEAVKGEAGLGRGTYVVEFRTAVARRCRVRCRARRSIAADPKLGSVLIRLMRPVSFPVFPSPRVVTSSR
jgi:hypothetical protein